MDTITKTRPSIPQMLNRALHGHRRALEALTVGERVADVRTAGELQGWKTVFATLRRWGCVDDDGITERGHELLTALRKKDGAA